MTGTGRVDSEVDNISDKEVVTTCEGEADDVTAIYESESVIDTDEEVVALAEGRVTILRVNDEGEVKSETSKNVGTCDGVADATSRDSVSTSDGEPETLHEIDINKLTLSFLKHYLKQIKQPHSQGNNQALRDRLHAANGNDDKDAFP